MLKGSDMDEHAQRSKKQRRWRGLFGKFVKQQARVNERFCPYCKKPYQPGPQPAEFKQFIRFNLGALVYPAGSWGRPTVVVRFGRWRANSNRFFLSEFVPLEELPDFIRLAAKVHASLTAAAKVTKRQQS